MDAVAGCSYLALLCFGCSAGKLGQFEQSSL